MMRFDVDEASEQQRNSSGRASLVTGSTPANQLQGVMMRFDVDEASEQYRIPLSLMLAKVSKSGKELMRYVQEWELGMRMRDRHADSDD